MGRQDDATNTANSTGSSAAANGNARSNPAAGGITSSSSSEGIIRTIDLRKTYQMGETVVRALDGVDICIDEGELLAITGPSGSGKSTLMHLLGCLDTPDGGQYILAGEDVSVLEKDDLARIRNRRIGFVFQSFNLLPRLSALENTELPLLYSGHPNAKAKARQALETVGLGERTHHEPSQLSGGQRQRVAIARAIVTDPTIILADEPTGNLDSRTGEEILELFSELHQQGRTIIMVTHDVHVADTCQRQIKMRDGRVVSDGRGTGTDASAADGHETSTPPAAGGRGEARA